MKDRRESKQDEEEIRQDSKTSGENMRRKEVRGGDEAQENRRTYPEEEIRRPGCWLSLTLCLFCLVWFLLFTQAYITVLCGGKMSAALNLSESFHFACLKHFQEFHTVQLSSTPSQ